MSSALVSRSLPVAGGALVALAGIFALNQGQARDASRLTAELAQASDHLVALDYRLRHPDLVAAEERRKRVSAQQGRIRLLTPLRDQPTVSEEITARFSTYVADGVSSMADFNAALAVDAAYKRIRRWMQGDQSSSSNT